MKPAHQLALAMLLVFSGLLLLAAAFLAPPPGEIHSSVLVAYGEISTFAGSLIGIDLKYRK